MDWRGLVLVAVLGVCIGLVSGFVENPPSEVGIPELKYYGYPLVGGLLKRLCLTSLGFLICLSIA